MPSSYPRAPGSPSKACLLPAVVVATFLGLGVADPVAGRAPDFRFERLSREQNLSQVTVTGLVEDRRGFLWIATQDGLNRFDGYELQVFKHDPRDDSSLSYSNLMGLYEDRSGELWALPFGRGAIDRYDAATGKFRRHRHDPADSRSLRDAMIQPRIVHDDGRGSLWLGSTAGGIDQLDMTSGEVTRRVHDPSREEGITVGVVTALLEDRRGDLWIGTRGGGLDRVVLDGEGGVRFIHHRHDPQRRDSLGDDRVTALHEDSSGAIWIGTGNGLDRLWPETGRFEHFRRSAVVEPTPRDIVRPLGVALQNAFLEDRSGSLWIATAGGLSRLGPERAAFHDYSLDIGETAAASGAPLSFLFEDSSGTLWVGTQGGGLHLYQPASDDFVVVRANPSRPEGLTSDYVSLVLELRSGLLWFGTYDAGLLKFSRQRNAIQYFTQDASDPLGLSDDMVFALLEDSAGGLWVGTMVGGLHRIDAARTRVVERYSTSASNERRLGSDFVRALLEDRRGRLWVGTAGGGMVEIDRLRGRVVSLYLADPHDPGSLSDGEVRSIFEDRRGRIWVATGGGWSQFHPESGRFTVYRNDPQDPNSLPNNSTRFTYEDRTGRLWVGTDMGLSRFDPASGRFTSFRSEPDRADSLSHDNIMDAYEDESGRFWVATYGGGLNLFDVESGSARHFTTADGLPNDSVYSVLPDGDGHLWLSTNDGLARFDPRRWRCETFDEGHGLQGAEFNGRAFHRTRRGELLFGGVNGFNAFFPRDIRPNTYVPPVVITGFRRMGRLEQFERAIQEVEEIVLSPRDRLVAFEFAALDFTRPEKNQYAYRLEGFDDSWVDNGARRTAQYTNLDPGRYVFRVRGSNSDGVWNENGAAVRLVVVPPVWRRWWAYAVYSLLAGGVIFGYVHLKNARHAEELERQREAAEAERKSRELESARRLQLSMVPSSPPVLPGLDVASSIRTATEVGGDYFDFFPRADGSLLLAIGDATGHGLPAGMMVGMTRAAIHAVGEGSPSQILSELNRVIREVHPERMNMALTLAEVGRETVRISAAGMPPAFVVRAADGAVEELLLPGLPLGALASAGYLQATARIEPGDALLFLSDGLPELRSADGRVLGYAAIEERLRKLSARPAEAIVRALVDLGEEWSGGRTPDDDVTLVVVRRQSD